MRRGLEWLEGRLLLTVGIEISELMASNDSVLADEDGTYSDWIELHNATAAPVDLTGWYLTDTAADLVRWQFPATTLGPDAYLVVFASGKDRRVSGQQLHTNFKLSAAGEYLALVQPDGASIEFQYAPEFPPQNPNVSYGVGIGIQDTPVAPTSGKFLVPDALTPADSWREVGYDDSSWSDVTTGVGYQHLSNGAADGPIGYWTFDDTGDDLSGYNHPATLVGATYSSEVPAQIGAGKSLSLSGGSQYAVVNPIDVSETAMTLSFWFKTAQSSRGLVSAAAGELGAGGHDREVYLSGTNIAAQLRTGATNQSITSSGRTYNNNAWHHVAYVFQQGVLPHRIYVDGNSTPVATGAGSASLLTSQDRLYFGFAAAAALDYLNGRIDDVAVWDIALSPAQIAALAAGTSPIELTSYAPDIATDVGAALDGVNATGYLRLPFELADPAAFDSLTLRLKYDDGVVVWLNGVEVARRNAPDTLAWDSAATAPHLNHQAIRFEELDLTGQLGLLQSGPNVLALQGLNLSAADNDFLLRPELVDVDISGLVEQFYDLPTPGGPNSTPQAEAVADPQFSLPGGPVSGPISLQISTNTPDAAIHYTLDGSMPNQGSPMYSGPIAVNGSTLVRARAFRSGFTPSNIVSQGYSVLATEMAAVSSNLPIVVINTYGGGIVADTLNPSHVTIFNTEGERNFLTDAPQISFRGGIKVRGSSSAGFAQQQYGFETWDETNQDKPLSILGMPEESDWIIYAPYAEKSLLQNPLLYELASQIGGGRYEVRTRYIEVYLDTNGGTLTAADYRGVYVWMERIDIGPDRVDIDNLGPLDNTGSDVTGGYLLKNDRADDSCAQFITTAGGQPICMVDPEYQEASTEQRSYLTGYFNSMEQALNGPNFADPVLGYQAYLDVDSWIDNHIQQEFAKNIDGYRLSQFFYKDRDGKLLAGPAWDFNLSMGNANYLTGWDPAGWYYSLIGGTGYPYYPRLFADPNFQQRYIDRWFELRDTVLSDANVQGLISDYESLLAEAAARHHTRWGRLGVYDWPNIYFGQGDAPQNAENHPARTWRDEVAWVRQFLRDRALWIDNQFKQRPTFSQDGGSIAAGFSLSVGSPQGGAVYYTLDGSDPRASGGAVSPAAQEYSGPVTLTENTRVIARVKIGSDWSAPRSAVFAVDAPELAISEIMYNPAPAPGTPYVNDDFEYLELRNVGAAPIELGGMRLARGVDFTFPTATIGPGEHAVVARNAEAFAARYPGVIPLGVFSGALDNGGETLELVDRSGATVVTARYDDDWQPHTDRSGFSLVLQGVELHEGGDPYQTTDRDDWRASWLVGGNPGAADPGIAARSVVISEVLTNSAAAGDWIELHNTTAADLDLSGWYLSDDGTNLTKYQLAAGTVLPAGAYLLLTEADDFGNPADPGALVPFALDRLGGNVLLSSPAGGSQAGGYRTDVDFGAAALGVTFGRHLASDGGSDFTTLAAPTPGAANAAPLVGPLVISELMYHPAGAEDEFIELVNVSAGPVELFDPANPSHTWRITDGVDFTFPTGVTLAAGERVLVVPTEPEAFRARYAVAASVQIFGPYLQNLDDGGEAVELSRPDLPSGDDVPYVRVDRVNYDDDAPWNEMADGIGPALARLVDGAYGNDVANWTASHSGGTPAAANSAIDTTPPSLVEGVIWAFTGVGTTNPRSEITWSAADDAETAVAYYKVFRKGSATVPARATPLFVGTTATTAFTDNTVDQGPVWQYLVSAVNADGLEGPLSTLGPTVPSTAADAYIVLEDASLATSLLPDLPQAILPAGSVWRYLDNGSNQGTAWRAPEFNDASWAQGPAVLGYGDGDEATVVSYGPDANNKYVTTYFRRSFTVGDVREFNSLSLNLKRDDGASVYLNGAEIVRDNLPGVLGDASVAFNTSALGAAGDDGGSFVAWDLDPAALREGVNTLAVEIHQATAASSDVSFDLSITGTRRRTGLLANDIDPEFDPLTVVKLSDPAHGQILDFRPDGVFTYQPDPDYFGEDSFTYKAQDASSESPATTVTISVLPVNDPPTPLPGGPYVTAPGVSLTLAGGASDPESPADALVYEWDLDYDGASFQIDLTGPTPAFSSPTAFPPRTIALRVRDPQGAEDLATTTLAVETPPASQVLARYVFYNNSLFDGRNPAAGPSDDAAIASDKSPLLPGGTASFANYTSYARGINGLMIDVENLPGPLSGADFVLRVGNDNSPGGWTPLAAAPAVSLRPGAGIGGSTRVTLILPDGLVRGQWLQVTLLSGAASGLAVDDVFYFGNAVGEVGNSDDEAVVSAADELLVRASPHHPFPILPVTSRYDFNRDGLRDARDQIIARTNATTAITALRLIEAPSDAGMGLAADALAVVDEPMPALRRRRR